MIERKPPPCKLAWGCSRPDVPSNLIVPSAEREWPHQLLADEAGRNLGIAGFVGNLAADDET